jgi:methyl-accepting chemotaxis protein
MKFETSRPTMKVSTRLSLGFGLVIALLLVVAVIAILSVRSLANEVHLMGADRYPKTVWANEIAANVNFISRAMRDAVLIDDPAKSKEQIGHIAEARKVIVDGFDKLKATIHSEEGKAHLAKALESRSHYISSQDKFIELVNGGKEAEAIELLHTTVGRLQDDYLASVSGVVKFQGEL